MPRNVAVVIGVETTPGFIQLPGAVAGAREFADWAERKGFEVHRFIDADTGPVSLPDLEGCIAGLLDPPTVDKLFIYFAGHGFATGPSQDYWLLSTGLQRASNIVNAGRSIDLARWAAVPHVAIFADACRTVPLRNAIGIAGTSPPIFGNLTPPQYPGVVDVFYASQTGDPALETQELVGDFDRRAVRAQGIFTRVLMDALNGTNQEATRPNPETGARVVHASSLKQYLTTRVPEVAGNLEEPAVQQPDCRDLSELPLFITEVVGPDTARMTVDVIEANGQVAQDATLIILRETPDAFERFKPLESTKGPTYVKDLPTSAIYGVKVRVGEYTQNPNGPCEIRMLMDDVEVHVQLKRPVTSSPRRGGGNRPASLSIPPRRPRSCVPTLSTSAAHARSLPPRTACIR